MDEQALEAIRQQLDADLKNVDDRIGIAFGIELYIAFGKKRWLTWEKFGVSGTGAFPLDVIAYRKTHNAVANWEVPEWEYKIGRRDV